MIEINICVTGNTRLKQFDVINIGGEKIIVVPFPGCAPIRYYLKISEIFDPLHKLGHGGRDRMEKMAVLQYSNLTCQCISNYLKICIICEKNRQLPKKGLVVKPMLFKHAHSQRQVDLIDICKHVLMVKVNTNSYLIIKIT